MPTHVKIIRPSDFLIATPTGQIDFENSQRLLKTVASASATLDAHEILLDMRNARSELSASDLWHLASELSRCPDAFPGKIAIVCRHSGQADFFALCAQNRGFPVNVFTTFEDAVEWFSAHGSGHFEHVV